jgi:hypothetical protein
MRIVSSWQVFHVTFNVRPCKAPFLTAFTSSSSSSTLEIPDPTLSRCSDATARCSETTRFFTRILSAASYISYRETPVGRLMYERR